jgi:hypothetical protein
MDVFTTQQVNRDRNLILALYVDDIVLFTREAQAIDTLTYYAVLHFYGIRDSQGH